MRIPESPPFTWKFKLNNLLFSTRLRWWNIRLLLEASHFPQNFYQKHHSLHLSRNLVKKAFRLFMWDNHGAVPQTEHLSVITLPVFSTEGRFLEFVDWLLDCTHIVLRLWNLESHQSHVKVTNTHVRTHTHTYTHTHTHINIQTHTHKVVVTWNSVDLCKWAWYQKVPEWCSLWIW